MSRTIEIFDADYKFMVSVPSSLVAHFPPAHLNITRLVLCRNYRSECPESCSMGSGCKFVHVDVQVERLTKHPIHVNYAWREPSLVTYQRLPAGETLEIMAPNNRPPIESVASENILVTRGSMLRKEHTGPLSYCAHYYYNRMCNRGERCNFIHAVHINPTATDFQRAPARPKQQQQEAMAMILPQKAPRSPMAEDSSEGSEHDLSCSSEHGSEGRSSTTSGVVEVAKRVCYSHNPYSLVQPLKMCAA